ncbi:MAG: hypothetical protein ACP5R4_09655, partial [Armatimonadota bacterium]
RSDRGLGRASLRSLNIALTGEKVPPSLKRVDLEVLVAGQKHTRAFPPTPQQSFTFSWDGRDGFGRRVYGKQPATVRIGYVYNAVYMNPDQLEYSFGRFGSTRLEGGQTRQEIVVWQDWRGSIGSWDVRTAGFGGWTPDILHSYDPVGRVLLLGDGTVRTAQNLGVLVISTVAGRPEMVVPFPMEGPARAMVFLAPMDVAPVSDGSYYVSDVTALYRVGTDGIARAVPLPKTQGASWVPKSLSVAPNGTLYIVDFANSRIGRMDPDGSVSVAAGTGKPGYGGDGGPAVQAELLLPQDVDVAPDGSVYIADTGNNRIRRVAPDGTITTIAGGGSPRDGLGDGGPAVRAVLSSPSGVAVGPDGSIYIADTGNDRVRRIGLDGIIQTIAGGGNPDDNLRDDGPAVEAELNAPNSIAVGPDGTLYIADTGHYRVRMVGPDGVITTVAGIGIQGYGGDGGPAVRAKLGEFMGIGLAPDGSLYIADTENRRIRRVASSVPGASAGQITIASFDGSKVFIFDARGKHLRTVDSLSGTLLYEFSYDSAGRLTAVRDGYGNTTSIERSIEGNSGVILSPFGHRTRFALDAGGYLAWIADPAGNTYQFSHTADGLLTASTDPNGNTHRYTYDEFGRLVRDEGPEGFMRTLARSPLPNGFSVTVAEASGTASIYSIQRLAGGSLLLKRSSRCGTRSQTEIKPDGSSVVIGTDGTVIGTVPGPDPRFGFQAPIISELLVTTPGKLGSKTVQSRRVELLDPNNLLSLKLQTDLLTVNGRIYTRTYDSASRTLRDATPGGRTTTTIFNEIGRPISVETSAGLLPIVMTYDSKGRVVSVQQGNVSKTHEYDEKGRVASVAQADGSKLSVQLRRRRSHNQICASKRE